MISPAFRFVAAAVVLGILGVGWRAWLTWAGTPPTNSDEAMMGLAALHISQGRELPVFFYGQHYMGTIEAYLAAPLVAAFGPSVYALRVPTLLLYVAFLVTMFLLVRRLFSAGLAVLTVGLLALGSDRVVKNQLIAGGGYPESGPMVAGLLLLTCTLLTRSSRSRSRHRWLLFAGWGLLFGLIAWNHWLPLPFLLAALFVLLVARVFTRRTALSAAAGFLLGVAPLIANNARAGLAHNSVVVFLGLNGMGAGAPLGERIVGGAWLGLPLGMGLCAPGRCAGWSLWWGPVVVVLLVVALLWSVRDLRRPAADEERARQWLRLALAGAGLLSIVSYVRSPAAAHTPVESARYLSMLLICLPVALWPLWLLIRSGRRWAPLAGLPVGALVVTMFAATVTVVGAVPGYAAIRDGRSQLIAALDDAGVTYVHGEYWACNWITYLSAERIVCGVVDDRGGRGFNRYPAYWRPRPQAYVAQVGSPLDVELARRLPAVTPTAVGGYHVYPGPSLADAGRVVGP